MMADRNNPRALGCGQQQGHRHRAPPTPRATVTRSGSPPNAAMLSRTHLSAAIWSRSPRLLGTSASVTAPRSTKPKTPRR